MTKEYKGYIIHANGKVYSNKLNTRTKGGSEIKSHMTNSGYLQLTLTFEGKQRKFKVHRLVATVFHPNPDNLPEVNHKDGNKLNNHKDNLEWNTRLDNVKHSIENNLKPMGEKHPFSKWSNAQIKNVRDLLIKGETPTSISVKTNIPRGTIYSIRSNRTRNNEKNL